MFDDPTIVKFRQNDDEWKIDLMKQLHIDEPNIFIDG